MGEMCEVLYVWYALRLWGATVEPMLKKKGLLAPVAVDVA